MGIGVACIPAGDGSAGAAAGGVSLRKTTLFRRRSCKNNQKIIFVIFAIRHQSNFTLKLLWRPRERGVGDDEAVDPGGQRHLGDVGEAGVDHVGGDLQEHRHARAAEGGHPAIRRGFYGSRPQKKGR